LSEVGVSIGSGGEERGLAKETATGDQ